MAISFRRDPELHNRLKLNNLRRQLSLAADCVAVVRAKGIEAVDRDMLFALNAAAQANIDPFGGRYRTAPVHARDHEAPPFAEVPDLMQDLFGHLGQDWTRPGGRCQLAAYGAWRLAWIHPFQDGNGRTANALAYILICARAGAWLPGKKILPLRIIEARDEQYAALAEADRAWEQGRLDITALERLYDRLLDEQLAEAGIDLATRRSA